MNHHHQPGRAGNEIPRQLAAACDTFGEMVTILGQHADQAGHWIIPFVMALAEAANGRDCMLTAPSIAGVASRRPPRTGLAGQAPQTIADTLARQAWLLSVSLTRAAQAAAVAGDRAALAAGSGHAAAVHDVLAGAGLWLTGQPWEIC
jgi:hypothetical protein